MIEIINRQRRHPIELEHWRVFAEQALCAIGAGEENRSATVAFISDRAMRQLNNRFRGRNQTTDVLSFPNEQDDFEKNTSEKNLGDVVISIERARSQAEENKLEFEREVAQLILHGLLHLCGYDHETDSGEMNKLELRLRRRLHI
jgi:probable rRNA maturation factor